MGGGDGVRVTNGQTCVALSQSAAVLTPLCMCLGGGQMADGSRDAVGQRALSPREGNMRCSALHRFHRLKERKHIVDSIYIHCSQMADVKDRILWSAVQAVQRKSQSLLALSQHEYMFIGSDALV